MKKKSNVKIDDIVKGNKRTLIFVKNIAQFMRLGVLLTNKNVNYVGEEHSDKKMRNVKGLFILNKTFKPLFYEEDLRYCANDAHIVCDYDDVEYNKADLLETLIEDLLDDTTKKKDTDEYERIITENQEQMQPLLASLFKAIPELKEITMRCRKRENGETVVCELKCVIKK